MRALRFLVAAGSLAAGAAAGCGGSDSGTSSPDDTGALDTSAADSAVRDSSADATHDSLPDASGDAARDAATDSAVDSSSGDSAKDAASDSIADVPDVADVAEVADDGSPDGGGDVATDSGLADSGTTDSDAASSDATGCPSPTDTLFVDGSKGSDVAGNGSASCPFRSITHALSVAGATPAIGTVHVAGATGSPLVYSAATTGEAFPLQPRAGLSLVGDGAALVTIVGSSATGSCVAGFSGPTLCIGASGVTVSGVTVTNPDPTFGVGIGVAATGFTLDAASLSGCSGDGLDMFGASTMTATNVDVTGNASIGVYLASTASLVATGVTFASNFYDGLFLSGSSSATTTGCTFHDNGLTRAATAGVNLISTSRWTSTGDTLRHNQNGVLAGGASGDSVHATMTGSASAPCVSQGNLGDGASIFGSGSVLTISGCAILGNGGNGVSASTGGTANLGDGTATAPGGNVLQCATATTGCTPNVLAGVCNKTTSSVHARADHWSSCPPTENPGAHDCSGAVDFGTNASGGTIDTTGCLTP